MCTYVGVVVGEEASVYICGSGGGGGGFIKSWPVRVAMLVWERALEGDMQKKTGKQVLQRQRVVGPTCSSPSS